MVDWQSPQVSARTPACLRDSAKKMPNGEPLGINFWWRRRESNPRPKVLYSQIYILSQVIWL